MRLVSAVAALLRRLRVERGVVALVFAVVAITSFGVAAGPRLFNRVADDALRYEAIPRHSHPAQHPVHERRPRCPPDDRSVRSRRGPRRWAPDAPAAIRPASRRRHPVHGRHDPLPGRRAAEAADGRDAAPAGWARGPGRARRRTMAWPVVPDADADPADPRADRGRPVRCRARRRSESTSVTRWTRTSTARTRCCETSFPSPWRRSGSRSSGRSRSGTSAAPVWFGERAWPRPRWAGPMSTRSHTRPRCSRPRPTPACSASSCRAGTVGTMFVDVDEARRGRRRRARPGPAPARVVTSRRPARSGLARPPSNRGSSASSSDTWTSGPRRRRPCRWRPSARWPVAIAAVGLIGVLVVRRRRPALALARGRGASGGQLLAAQLWEGLLVTVPAALVGLLAALAVVTARASDLSSIGVLLVAAIATALLVAGDLAHRPARASRPRARRPARLPDLAAPARLRDARDRPLDRRRLAPPRARPDQRDRHGADDGLRSVPGGVAGPDRPRRRA